MNDLQPSADLTLAISRPVENRYWLELRYTNVDGQAEQAPVSGPVQIDLTQLRRAALDSKAYGKSLKDSLFHSQALREFFLQCVPAAAAGQRSLRLRLLIDSSAVELHNLRWETLRDPNDQEYLALSNDMPFSRFLYSSDWRQIDLRRKGQLRALVVVANPSTLKQGITLAKQRLAAVDVQGEIDRARSGLKGISTVDVLESLDEQPGRVTIENIQTELAKGYDIVYLACHGALMPEDPDVEGSPERPYLILENDAGRHARIDGERLVEIIRGLPPARRPRMVVLASCQSGGQGKVPVEAKDPGETDEEERSYDRGALAALGPRLVAEGIPAVMAMQYNITVETLERFMPRFFQELTQHGVVDSAMSAARNHVAHRADWWVPVLYLRLRGGRLWYEPGFSQPGGAEDLWSNLVGSIDQQVGIPILGAGMLEQVTGPTEEIARRLAQQSRYPLAAHAQQDISQVAQYIAARGGWQVPRTELEREMRIALRKKCVELGLDSRDRPLIELLRDTGKAKRLADRDPYRILARLPYPIYIIATPDNLMEEALREVNKEPQVLHYCWKSQLRTPDMVKRLKSLQKPSPEKPLVYYMFGQIDNPASWVLTEDDYFEYLMWINKPDNGVPEVLKNAWTHNPLLFLGFKISDWNFRVLFRSILNEERRREISALGSTPAYYSVAVQLHPGDDNLRPEGARVYLMKYFPSSMFNLYWGSAEDFLAELWEQWQARKQEELDI